MGDEAGETRRPARLDGLRGLAALWVVLFHVGSPSAAVAAALPRWLFVPLFEWGHLGVPVFFTLSGFVIARSLRSVDVDGARAGRFMVRRLLRLTPPYYVSLFAVLSVATLSALIEHEPFQSEGPITVARGLAHLVYLQEALGFGSFQPLYWTLCFEMAFYLVFIGVLWAASTLERTFEPLRRRHLGLPLLLVPTLVVALAAAPAGDGGLPLPTPFSFLPTFSCFLVGALVFWAVDGRFRWWPAAVVVELLVCVGAMRWEGFHITSALTALLLATDLPRLEAVLSSRLPRFLGTTSYSTYLIHPPVLGIAAYGVQETLGRDTTVGGLVEVAVGVTASLVAGWVLWRVVEQRSIIWSQRAASGSLRPRAWLQGTPGGYSSTEDATAPEETCMAGYHDDKAEVLARLRRIEGQVRGLQRMVDDEAYCIDVLTQVSSVTRALQAVSVLLLGDHLHHCVADAVAEGAPDAAAKVDEAMKSVERLIRS